MFKRGLLCVPVFAASSTPASSIAPISAFLDGFPVVAFKRGNPPAKFWLHRAEKRSNMPNNKGRRTLRRHSMNSMIIEVGYYVCPIFSQFATKLIEEAPSHPEILALSTSNYDHCFGQFAPESLRDKIHLAQAAWKMQQALAEALAEDVAAECCGAATSKCRLGFANLFGCIY